MFHITLDDNKCITVTQKNNFQWLYRSSIFLFFLTPWLIKAQEPEPVDQQLWLEYLVDYDLGSKVDLYSDAGYRAVFLTGVQNSRRIMARPSVKWTVSDLFDLRGGFGFFYDVLNDTTKTFEFRPWQGVSVHWPTIGRQRFTQFIRTEERLTYRLEPWSRASAFRLRYQLSTRIRFNRIKVSNYLYAPLAMEFFFTPSGEKLFEFSRNNARFTVGLGYVFNYRFALEGRFVFQRSRLVSGTFSVTDQIFRIMLRHSLYPVDQTTDEVVN